MGKNGETKRHDSANGNERSIRQNFIRAIVEADSKTDKYQGRVVTRFPPEPNGYPHIGHAKSIWLNFGIAQEFGGECHLRMDDTNPETEDMKYVVAMQEAIRWLGFDWGEQTYFASDYFAQLYQFAENLIMEGKAYVDSLNEEEIRDYRGTVTEAGRNSPYRDRSVAENLDLFRRMRAGEFSDGQHVLRAKGDMASPNMKMRDPLLYRIRHASHYRTGNTWCIYPMYDFAHPLSDAIEGITHSICTLEFENNREIYDWLMENLLEPPRPHQYEFARLALDYTVMSKRKMLRLVEEGHVSGWDDPRMATLAGMRRRGYTPAAIRDFCEKIGVAKVNSRVDMALLEHCIRSDLNFRAPRVMAVLRPLKVVITNFPDGQVDSLDAPYWPHDIPKEGSRQVPFSRLLYIEQDDFRIDPPRGWKRLSPGAEVRLRYSYVIKCVDVIQDAHGEVMELHCTYDPDTLGQNPVGRKVQGPLHWVSAEHSLPCEVRLYDRLFDVADPEAGDEDFITHLNPNSLKILRESRIEPSVANDPPGMHYQFERQGFFIADEAESRPDALVFNRTVTLRDSWARTTQGLEPSTVVEAVTREELAKAVQSNGHVGSRSEARDQARAANAQLASRFLRYQDEMQLSDDLADILTGDLTLSEFFEEAVRAYTNPRVVASWVTNELMGELKGASLDTLPFHGTHFGALVKLVDNNTISSSSGKTVLVEMIKQGGDPHTIVERNGLRQISDIGMLAPIVDKILAANADKVAEFRSGKTGLAGFFVGQVMRQTGGTANPQLVKELLAEKLGNCEL